MVPSCLRGSSIGPLKPYNIRITIVSGCLRGPSIGPLKPFKTRITMVPSCLRSLSIGPPLCLEVEYSQPTNKENSNLVAWMYEKLTSPYLLIKTKHSDQTDVSHYNGGPIEDPLNPSMRQCCDAPRGLLRAFKWSPWCHVTVVCRIMVDYPVGYSGDVC